MQIDYKTYWRGQLRRTGILLAVWAVVGFGLSILFVEQLNLIRIGDMPLGFWMAQQGSIFVFILLIFLYAVLSGRADRAAGLDTDAGGVRGASSVGSPASLNSPSGESGRSPGSVLPASDASADERGDSPRNEG